MSAPENPPGFIVRTEVEKAAWEKGYRLDRGVEGPWRGFESTTVPGRIWLAGIVGGPWFLALDHAGVVVEMGEGNSLSGPGVARYAFPKLEDLYEGLDRVWRLSFSLPSAPLQEFEARTADLPRNTEAERLVVQRVGQNVFRAALMKYWNGRCPVTGITEPELLRASHIVAWAECDDDAHRLDVHNGLMLSALWDAAFDKGLVSFGDAGVPLYSPKLSAEARARLEPGASLTGCLTTAHHANLARHRRLFGFGFEA
jgi:hypothetical protein